VRERELRGPVFTLRVAHDEQAQRDARAIVEVVVPGAVVVDRALDDLGFGTDREPRPPGGVEAAGERGLELRLLRMDVVLDADAQLDL
jgi:hypothetical protein